MLVRLLLAWQGHELKCSETHHAPPSADHYESANFVIFFVSTCIVVGALARRFSPRWLPYTVTLLLLGLAVGAGASALSSRAECPMNALRTFDRDGDALVSRDEWSEFECVGCAARSVCAARACDPDAPDASSLNSSLGLPSGVASGVASAVSRSARLGGGCSRGWTFASLDAPFRLSAFHVAWVDATSSDGYLSADELWSVSCNLLEASASASRMDPHLLLLAFLPALLFESAIAVDMGVLRRQLGQIVLLAGPGVVVASSLTAGLILLVRPSWPFGIAWLVGTILSATDPVAVVALLKELGADKAVGTLIEGESLLNDGSAVVLFFVLRNWVTHGNDSGAYPAESQRHAYPGGWLDLCRIVGQMLLFGVLYGAAAGAAVCRLLRHVYNDAVVEIGLTLGAAYLLFWSAEVVLGSSAVLAVVVMGFYLNHSKALCVSPEVVHLFSEFYEVLAWALNTVVFVVAGVALGRLLHEASLLGGAAPKLGAWLLLYPGVLLARGLTILLLYPALRRLGLGLDARTALVLWWGGLRGSVGLALALIVSHDEYSQATWGGAPAEGVGSAC